MTPQNAVQKLRNRGLTLASIAKSSKSKTSTIFDIAKGDDPRWKLGQKLIALATKGEAK